MAVSMYEEERPRLQLVLDRTARQGDDAGARRAPLDVVGEMVTMAAARSQIDAALLVCVQDLLLRAGEKLLTDRGVTDVSGLSRTAHQTWRAHTKAAVAGELQVALGTSVTEARQMVAVASAPAAVRSPVLGALRRGEVHWAMVRRFQSRTARLDPDDSAEVAKVLFGTDASLAAPERLDPDGGLTTRPWHHQEYFAALDREVTRVQGRDERAARERRRVALSLRDARLDVTDEGTATLAVTGSLATMLALNGRVESMARRCRKAGDGRTLAQLRADVCASLLLLGTVSLPGPDEESVDEIVTPDDVAALAAVVNATPSGTVELVVPWDALLGRAVCPRCRAELVPRNSGGAGLPEGHGPPEQDGPPEREGPPEQDSRPEPHGKPEGHGSPEGHGPPDRHGPSEREGPPGWVGELRGYPSAWIMPEEARDIALRPGSTFYRLLTDPADGRLVERTIARYAPDADMRRQIRAADVYGRGPGCRRPAGACELDHEHAWDEGGPTSEANLNAKSLLDHFRKTRRLWRSVMNPRRDLTFTTLLGQVARTRGHDYRQYADAYARWVAPPPGSSQDEVDERSDLAERRDLADQVLYAALVSRRPGEKTQAEDDVDGCEDWLCVKDWGSVSYRDATGRRRYGTPPDSPTPERVLGVEAVDGPGRDLDGEKGDGSQRDVRPGGASGTGGWARTERSRRDDPPPF